MVKDDSGRLVNGLLSRDFAVFEDGKKQNLNFFTTDPFALSAAVIFDTGMPDVAVQKVNQTFSALEGAFSQFDEVSLYTYSTSVSKVTDFAAVGQATDRGAGQPQDGDWQKQRASRDQRAAGAAGTDRQRRARSIRARPGSSLRPKNPTC